MSLIEEILLKKDVIQRSIVTTVAFQSPWGQWLSIGNQAKRLKRVRRYDAPVIPKPNGFRTLLSIDSLSSWIEPRCSEVTEPASAWFNSACESGWFRLFKFVQSHHVASIGSEDNPWRVEISQDLRHTAQALETFAKTGHFKLAHVETLRELLSHQRESGVWPYIAYIDSEQVFSTFSCLTLIDYVLTSQRPVFSLIREEYSDEIKIKRNSAIAFFSKQLLVSRELTDLFDVGVCISRLFHVFDRFAPFLNERAMSYFRDSWERSGRRWVGREQDDDVELYSVIYSAFSKGANLDDDLDIEVLSRTAEHLNHSLEVGRDATAFIFAIDGASTLLQRTESSTSFKMSFGEVTESESYLPALHTIFTLVLLDRLHGFRALLEIEDLSNEWKSVVNREAEYLGLLIENILTISDPKPEDQRAPGEMC
jgi:hypothetical protein